MNLLLVESPTKARTLSHFLSDDFRIEATMGHIRDLPGKNLGLDISVKDHTIKIIPNYQIVKGKKAIVDKLKKLAQNADSIILATDPDREGEAIAWHTMTLLRQSQKSPPRTGQAPVKSQKFARVVFHQITKEAILEAMKNPRSIDMNLVNAQQARRILDRMVGYKLSPMLWKKIRRGLSAGRVQSVTVRLIVDREREIEAFNPEEYWEVFVDVTNKTRKNAFTVKLISINGKSAKLTREKESSIVVDDLKIADYSVGAVARATAKQSPWVPFTTSTLQQAASSLFRWSGKRTMMVAQGLYEHGYITYHRTDSLNIAKEAVDAAREIIPKKFGLKYLSPQPRFYRTKSKLAQEAHEAIRPTNISHYDSLNKIQTSIKRMGRESIRLYELIWKRFIGTQMADQIFDKTVITVAAQGKKKYLLQARGQVEIFDGWRTLYDQTKSQPENEPQLPSVKKLDPLKYSAIHPKQNFTAPPSRYTEAMLIKALESRGIGRPSTYAPTISTIRDRGYVEKNENRFHPTPVGLVVNDFLVEYFPSIVDYDFTREMEDGLDRVASQENDWQNLLGTFWGPFEKRLSEVAEKAERKKIPVESTGDKCPQCEEGEQVIRSGRFGKFLSCSTFPKCKFTKTYLEKTGQKCPECQKGDVVIKKTRRGKSFFGCSNYPKCQWASWRKPK